MYYILLAENGLYNQFLDVLQAFRISSPLQLLEILQYFIDNCIDTISILKDQNQVKQKLYNFINLVYFNLLCYFVYL